MAIAVKAFIVNDGKVLIVKRALDEVHKPGIWEIPGGRIDKDESMEAGLIREVKEEVGIDIEVNREISVREFTRDDGQEIEMHIFLCNSLNDIIDIKLSEEHISFEWSDIEKIKEKLDEFYYLEVDLLLNLENEKWP